MSNSIKEVAQRRIKEWGQVMAVGLVYGCMDGKEVGEKPMLIGVKEGD